MQYIYEAVRAAREMLKICIDSLHPQQLLLRLPSRFLIWFQYAAVFLIKSVYAGAMTRLESKR